MPRCDLASEPWATMTVAGQPAQMSLLDTLTRAHEIDGLALDDPLQAVAVFRQVLLPAALHALGPPRSAAEWAQRWRAGRLDGDRIAEYLARRTDRFDLFHPERPFAQVAGLRTDQNKTKPVSQLLQDVATGNNVPLFTTRTEADPPALSPAAAARAVLAAHCWDTAAIKSGAVGDPRMVNGKTTGNPTGPLGQLGVIFPMGRTLAETLLLNMPIMPHGLDADDLPQWDVLEPWSSTWQARPARGLLDLLTWQSRRIRLVPEPDGTVRAVVLAAGDRLEFTPEFDPHTAWRTVDKPSAKGRARMPVRHPPGRAAWRGMASLLATTRPTAKGVSSSGLMNQLASLRANDLVPDDARLQVLIAGVVYGNQSAVVEDVVTDLIPLPIVALPDPVDPEDNPVRELLLRIVIQSEALRETANWLGDDLRRAVGAEKLPWDRGMRLGDALVLQFTVPVRRLLGGLQRQSDRVREAEDAWLRTARRLALATLELAVDAAPPEAFLGRQESEKVTHRLATAEARFRRRLNDTLGPAVLATIGGKT